MKALENEIRILRKLRHERIVSYYGSEQKDCYLHLFMEFMAGVRAYKSVAVGFLNRSAIGYSR